MLSSAAPVKKVANQIGFLIVDSGIGHLLEIGLLDAGKVH
jgi:hypothetical protein